MGAEIWETAVGQAVSEFMRRAVEYLPNLAGAVGLLMVGWVLGRVLRAVSRRLLAAALGALGRQSRMGRVLERTHLGPGFADLSSRVIFWLVMTLFAAAAIERLELPLAAALVSAFAAYLPRVLLGLAIVFAALVTGQFARSGVVAAAGAAGVPQAGVLGTMAQVGLLIFGVATAGDLLGIQSTLLTVVAAVSIGAVLGGATLAFGLGSGPAVTNIIAMFYVLKTYRVGQSVRVGNIEGEIVDVTQTGVVIAIPDGRVHVPGRRFIDDVTVLVTGGRS